MSWLLRMNPACGLSSKAGQQAAHDLSLRDTSEAEVSPGMGLRIA
jgi:hypothetical protein